MPSKRSSARQLAAAPPEFLIDRRLGRHLLVKTLGEAGLTVRTLADVYGEAAAQETEDVEWIRLAAERGWVILCKDDHIRRRPAERDALIEGCVRVFCLMNANLGFAVVGQLEPGVASPANCRGMAAPSESLRSGRSR